MSFSVFAIVLFAAALHASWNAVVKSGDDKVLMTIMVAASASVTAAMVLPFLASPARPCWPFIASSVLIHIVYFALVGSAYRVGDMGQVYPLMRGTAPFLVALASVSAFGEKLSIPAWMGVGLICVGIITMVKEGKASDMRGIYLALLNAIVIASYTLIDGAGTRLSGSPTAYAAWVFMLTGFPLMAWVVFARREAFVGVVRRQWRTGVFGGAATVLSYALVLGAMMTAPIAMVAALRETSILFGTAIAGIVLRERLGPARLIGAGLIGLGAVALRLA
ncbi:EamA family transporter [Hyphomicrobium sp.]|jgi:drug/metabolite transporter (DMT)-like permease|uniref:EamA family transporter n=1 Tax=Hyphomicrobium sp. TaxID=82 RepID=UPI003564B3C0